MVMHTSTLCTVSTVDEIHSATVEPHKMKSQLVRSQAVMAGRAKHLLLKCVQVLRQGCAL